MVSVLEGVCSVVSSMSDFVGRLFYGFCVVSRLPFMIRRRRRTLPRVLFRCAVPVCYLCMLWGNRKQPCGESTLYVGDGGGATEANAHAGEVGWMPWGSVSPRRKGRIIRG